MYINTENVLYFLNIMMTACAAAYWATCDFQEHDLKSRSFVYTVFLFEIIHV